ncbi:MAG: helix-turn-helix transcriptional regulator [Candidatus Eisenbacteria bacterium]|nr:helix-turn-helix transcriptional regulator [Candidatus Eisenbacteria bacterium]
MSAPRDKMVLRSPEQVAALGSPVRFRIVDILALRGASSVREIAVGAGCSVTSLYYHIRVLEKVGILEEAATRGTGRRMEKTYRLRAGKLVIDPKKRSVPYRRAMADSCAALLRRAERDYRAAASATEVRLEGEERDLMIRRLVLRLDSEGLARLNRLLDRVSAHAGRRGGAGGAPVTLTIAMSRVPELDR